MANAEDIPNTATHALLRARTLSCSSGSRQLLAPTTLDITTGLTAIVGPNGAGKSTLLKALAGLIRSPLKVAGAVHFTDQMHCAWLAQENQGSAYETNALSVEGLIRLAQLSRPAWQSRAEAKSLHNEQQASRVTLVEKTVERALIDFDLEAFRHQALHEVSGGQLQRAQLARVFAMNRPLILLDEPSNHLDLKHLAQLEALLFEQKKLGRGIVYCTHDLNFALRADRLILMQAGEIIADLSLREQESPCKLSVHTQSQASSRETHDEDIAAQLSACFATPLQVMRHHDRVVVLAG